MDRIADHVGGMVEGFALATLVWSPAILFWWRLHGVYGNEIVRVLRWRAARFSDDVRVVPGPLRAAGDEGAAGPPTRPAVGGDEG